MPFITGSYLQEFKYILWLVNVKVVGHSKVKCRETAYPAALKMEIQFYLLSHIPYFNGIIKSMELFLKYFTVSTCDVKKRNPLFLTDAECISPLLWLIGICIRATGKASFNNYI